MTFITILSTLAFCQNVGDKHMYLQFLKKVTLLLSATPVSLLNNLDKIFERIVLKHLYNYLHDIKYLSSFQSGQPWINWLLCVIPFVRHRMKAKKYELYFIYKQSLWSCLRTYCSQLNISSFFLRKKHSWLSPLPLCRSRKCLSLPPNARFLSTSSYKPS